MNEVSYVKFLHDQIHPKTGTALARAVVSGLTPPDLSPTQATRFAGSLWPWSFTHPQSPDLVLSDDDNQIVAVFEFKSLVAKANSPGRAGLRQAEPWPGERPRQIRDTYLVGSDPAFDRLHRDQDCLPKGGCGMYNWPNPRDGDLHHAAAHQGDIYASTVSWVPAGLQVPDQADVTFVFVAPHDPSITNFFRELVSADLWHVVRLPDALDYWRSQKDVPGVSDVVAKTEDFLGLCP